MSHGKRYTVKERKEILAFLENHTYQETMEKFEVSQMSLARWVKNKEKRNTNTTPPLLEDEIQKELQIYLKVIENSENVRAVAIVTAAGELILPETKGFHSIFSDVYDVSKITSNLLLCAKGFTAGVVNDQKQVDPVFDDVSISTPKGTFLLKGIGFSGALVTLFDVECLINEIFTQELRFINQIIQQMKLIF